MTDRAEKTIQKIEEWRQKWHWNLNMHCPRAQFALDEIFDEYWEGLHGLSEKAKEEV